jgi:hypothetical protein
MPCFYFAPAVADVSKPLFEVNPVIEPDRATYLFAAKKLGDFTV